MEHLLHALLLWHTFSPDDLGSPLLFGICVLIFSMFLAGVVF